MNPVLREILETHTTATPNGDRIPVTDSIDDAEAELLFQIIAEQKPTITLEVGLAAGVSALVICDAQQKTPANRHIIIDPFQNRQPVWGGIGLFNLRRAGFEQLIDFHESFSYRVLPQLEAKGAKIDFAFIDGRHTFDFVLVDFFYIDKMLPVGGIVVFDDADWPSIRRVIRFVLTNLPYSVHKRLPTEIIQQSQERKIYDGLVSLGSPILNGFRKLPGLEKPITRAFGAELLGVDKKFGLKGSLIALRKESEDVRKTDHHHDEF